MHSIQSRIDSSGTLPLHPSRAVYVWQNLTVMHAPERGVNRRY